MSKTFSSKCNEIDLQNYQIVYINSVLIDGSVRASTIVELAKEQVGIYLTKIEIFYENVKLI